MSGEKRRQEIMKYISESEKPVSGTKIAKMFEVSRQVIVQDVALLRAEGKEIISTNRGYVCSREAGECTRIFHVFHEDDRMEEELNLIVDLGGKAQDVFVQHEVYGELRADLSVDSRKKVKDFMNGIESGKSSPLNTITSGYHFHTVIAESEEILNMIEAELGKQGFLV